MRSSANELDELCPKRHRRAPRCGYAGDFGFRAGSGVAKMVDELREEHRTKFNTHYTLERVAKNTFRLVLDRDAALPAETRRALDDMQIEEVEEVARRHGVTISGVRHADVKALAISRRKK